MRAAKVQKYVDKFAKIHSLQLLGYIDAIIGPNEHVIY